MRVSVLEKLSFKSGRELTWDGIGLRRDRSELLRRDCKGREVAPLTEGIVWDIQEDERFFQYPASWVGAHIDQALIVRCCSADDGPWLHLQILPRCGPSQHRYRAKTKMLPENPSSIT